MNVIYKMTVETEPKTILNVDVCGMLTEHKEALYIRIDNGIETFIPLGGLEWYSVKAVGDSE